MDKFPKNMNWFASRCPLLIRLLSLKLYLVRAPSIAEPNCSWWKDLLGINRSVLPSCQLTILAPSCGKLRRYTQRVEIGIVSYNQNYGLISLVTVNFFLNRHLPQSRISSSRLSSVRFMEKSFMTQNPLWPMLWLVVILLMLSFQSASKVLGRIWRSLILSNAVQRRPVIHIYPPFVCSNSSMIFFLINHPPVLFDFQMHWVPADSVRLRLRLLFAMVEYEALVFSTSSSMCNPLGPAGCWEISLTRLPLGPTASDQGQRGPERNWHGKSIQGSCFCGPCVAATFQSGSPLYQGHRSGWCLSVKNCAPKMFPLGSSSRPIERCASWMCSDACLTKECW